MNLGPLVLIFAAALLAPVIAHATRGFVPIVVAQTLAGVALGVTGFDVLDPGRADLALLDTLGFATLMFTVGMHVPLRDERLRPTLPRGVRAALLALPLAVLAGWATHLIVGGPAVVYAVIIASSSAAVALPLMDERGASGESAYTAMSWIIAADVIAMVAVPLALAPGDAPKSLLGALAVAAAGAVLFFAVRRGRRLAWIHALRKEGKHRDWAIDLRAALLVLVSLSFIADKAGTSVLIAGFATGLVVGAIGGPKRLSREVLGLGQGFLIPVFFVLLGAKVDLRALGHEPGAIALTATLLAATLAVHLVISRVIRAPWSTGVLASAQMGVPAAVIALGLPIDALDQAEASAILCAAILSLVLAGAAARVMPAAASDGTT